MSAKKKKTSGAKGKGTIAIIVLFLLVSAGIRLASSAGAVLAEAKFEEQPKAMEARQEHANATGPTDEELDAMLRAFEMREAKISEQELQIEKRLKALQIADEKINERLAMLKQAEEELRATVALASTAAEDDLAKLTMVYENMKPKTAAALFGEMDPDFAAGFLGRMRPDAAASIMAGMAPDRAYMISAILAGRNANIPKN